MTMGRRDELARAPYRASNADVIDAVTISMDRRRQP
jgi:hypothetical protein